MMRYLFLVREPDVPDRGPTPDIDECGSTTVRRS